VARRDITHRQRRIDASTGLDLPSQYGKYHLNRIEFLKR